jgi:hypothetical protein
MASPGPHDYWFRCSTRHASNARSCGVGASGHGIAPAGAGQVDPAIYARWSIHHSRRATSSGVGAFFLECAVIRHLLLPFRQSWALRRRPSGGTIELLDPIGPRKESYRLPG